MTMLNILKRIPAFLAIYGIGTVMFCWATGDYASAWAAAGMFLLWGGGFVMGWIAAGIGGDA